MLPLFPSQEALAGRHLLSDEGLGFLMASYCNAPVPTLQRVLECTPLLDRQLAILALVQEEIERYRVNADVQSRVSVLVSFWVRG